MIAIDHLNKDAIKKVAQKHCDSIVPIIEQKLLLTINYAQTLLQTRSQRQRVYNASNLHFATKNALLKKVFFKNKKALNATNHTKRSIIDYYRLNSNNGANNPVLHLNELINICTWINDNIKDIIKGSPQELIDFHNYCISNHPNGYTYLKNKDILQFFFDYKRLTSDGYNKWDNISLLTALQSKTCYYCNRQYTLVVYRKRDNRTLFTPQLDHFFDQKNYPILGLSFYNLIPSCSNCNHKKSDNAFSFNTHIHPYLEGFGKDGFFSYAPISLASSQGESEDLDIKFHYSNNAKGQRVKNSVNELGLDFIYNKAHKDTVRELVKKKYICNDSYLKTLVTAYPEAKLSFKEAYQLAFGNYYDSNEFYKRPLAKLTRDIAEDLDLIDENLNL